MKRKVVFMLVLAMFWPALSSEAAQMSSDGFPYKYEASMLPSADSPAYTFTKNANVPTEGDYASVLDGILTLDSATDGADGDGAWYTFIGGTGTVWNPPFAGPFTMEVRMKSYPNNSAAQNCWFRWRDTNSSVLLQVWYNKVTLNGVEVTGLDNQTGFHVFRVVSDQYGASPDQRFDLYRDGVKIIDNAANVADYAAADFLFGDATGIEESKVQIDYIRWDDSNAWDPVPPGDSNGYPYRYEANALPSAISPAYTFTKNANVPSEAAYASVAGGILTLDSATDGADSDGAWYTLTGGTGTVWKPGFAGPFTMEVKMKSYPNNSAAQNCWFRWRDLNSSILLQVWYNKVTLNGTEVAGLDNQTDFHIFRVVSDQYGASADQRFDLYRDGVKIIDNAANVVSSGTDFLVGDATGTEESKVQIDYIRWDDGNAWIPPQCGVDGYLKGDINKDCLVDIDDIAIFTQGWLLSTNPENGDYIDCGNPINSDICN